jgi:two-component system chemotaxis response regulator CheY
MFPADAKIMIVDDSSFARTMLKNSLRELKYWKILEAGEGKAAQGLILGDEQRNDPIHLLILDIHMPELDGLSLLKWLREQEAYKELPVIIITSSQQRHEIIEAGKLGVSQYIVKPFETGILREKIGSTWVKHGQKFSESLKRLN